MNFKYRSTELEHLDKGDYTAEEYEGCLSELRQINRVLGDAKALRNSLLKAVERRELDKFSVLDVGAGSGELLRITACWAVATDRQALLIGLELNTRSAEAILEESAQFESIASIRGDSFHLPFADSSVDYVICSLFLHHFVDDKAVGILREISRVARRKIFVIDLHRHRLAYYLYTTVGRLFLRNRLIREDGALSILRAFRPNELFRLAEQARLKDIHVERRFPFRLVLSAGRNGTGAA